MVEKHKPKIEILKYTVYRSFWTSSSSIFEALVHSRS